MHLAVDGYGTDTSKFQDRELLYEFLDKYPTTLGMTKITEPKVLTYVGNVPEDWGLSGFVIIAESHISVHTFPSRNYINVDIFSCKEFDAEKALDDVKRVFGLKEVTSWTMGRGLDALMAGPSEMPEKVELREPGRG
jgi:S-adenosylmethionine decarboxylase